MQNGLKYIWVDVDPVDNKTYWVFEKDAMFNAYFYLYNLLNVIEKKNKE
jgi:hypothetical protein